MSGYRFRRALPTYLREQQERIEGYAREMGLDFFPTVFEMLAYDEMNEVAAFGGFPTRYPHWRFGMEYERLSKSAEYGLSKIYEMVINNNPSVAYLLEGNSLVDQKLVMAHVYGHVDFFKNNLAFGATDQGTNRKTGEPVRKWIDAMANHGAVIRKWSGRIGVDPVEMLVDSCLSLENLIDPNKPFDPPVEAPSPLATLADDPDRDQEGSAPFLLRVDRDYMQHFINPREFVQSQRAEAKESQDEAPHFPEYPERDVLGFLIANAPLDRWERDVLTVIRREAYYFLPQMQTKIMNEGWASYWHSRLMTERICDGSDIVDYADRNAGVMETSNGRLNPYKLGVELYRHIEARWDRGQFGKEWDDCDSYDARRHWDRQTGLGQKKLFEVRKLHTDVTFIDEFLTPEFVTEQKMYAFGYNDRNGRYEIETRQFHSIKQKMLDQLTNAGSPIIRILDANHANRGELLLKHDHHGADLRLDWAAEVLKALVRIWKRPVEIHTLVEEKQTKLRYDGHEYTQKPL